MNKLVRKCTLVGALVALMTPAVACGSLSQGNSSSETVNVDVGTATPIKLKTGELNLAILMNDTSNAWEQTVVAGARDEANKHGWHLDVMSPGFDVEKQLNQIQTAATGHKYDAVLAVPVDGKLTCNGFSKTLPEANVLVAVGAVQLCDRGANEGDALWQPGTLNWVGGTGVTAQYFRSWLNAAAAKNPGPQTAVLVLGPEVITLSNTIKQVVKEWQPQHPELKIQDVVYTDYTTPNAYQKTVSYLTAHPDTSLVLSTYSPDMTRGVVQAIGALNMGGKLVVADSGGSQYSFDQIRAGTIQFTSPLFPREIGQHLVDSVYQAQAGKAPTRYISDIPPNMGTLDDIPIFTKDNLDTFTPEY